jgi:small-conductance mechanosensitive channel
VGVRQDIASNYLSGVFLLMNRPFRPGMVVTVGDPGKKVRGTYVKMDLRYLYLKTDRDGPEHDTILLVPNSVVFASDISVSQPAARGNSAPSDGTLERITH